VIPLVNLLLCLKCLNKSSKPNDAAKKATSVARLSRGRLISAFKSPIKINGSLLVISSIAGVIDSSIVVFAGGIWAPRMQIAGIQ
jgi:hypothetical protein